MKFEIEKLIANVNRIKQLNETDAPNLIIINELNLLKAACEEAIKELEQKK